MAIRLKEFAYEAGFGELHSIGVYEPNYLAAQRRFAGIDKVPLHLGSIPRVLPSIINPALATTFWLDTHFQGSSVSEQDRKFGRDSSSPLGHKPCYPY
jgi:hypothetical protein